MPTTYDELERSFIRVSIEKDSLKKAVTWLLQGEVGESSKRLLCAGLGIPVKWSMDTYPHDAGDFRRCVQLLAEMPDLKYRALARLRNNVGWKDLIPCWDALTQVLEIELKEGLERSENLYPMIRALVTDEYNLKSGPPAPKDIYQHDRRWFVVQISYWPLATDRRIDLILNGPWSTKKEAESNRPKKAATKDFKFEVKLGAELYRLGFTTYP